MSTKNTVKMNAEAEIRLWYSSSEFVQIKADKRIMALSGAPDMPDDDPAIWSRNISNLLQKRVTISITQTYTVDPVLFASGGVYEGVFPNLKLREDGPEAVVPPRK